MTTLDLPRSFTIRASSHRIINPFTPEKLATLGEAIRLREGYSVLDLCCGKGEMLSTWSRDHAITGTGVDISTVFLAVARARATELGVADRVTFVHGEAAAYAAAHGAAQPQSARPVVDVAACIGATWIGQGVAGTIAILEPSLRPGGIMLVGEPFWRAEPPSQEAVQACGLASAEEYRTLPGLVELFGELEYDLVEMVLADEDSWDRYRAPQWRNVRTFIDAHPDDPLTPELRAELHRSPLAYTRYERRLVGWGVFALMKR